MAPIRTNNPVNLVYIGCAVVVVYLVGLAFYNVFLHPLRSYPGPLLWRISRFPKPLRMMRGDLAVYMTQLHKKYGPIVRISPDELAFCDPQAWKDIYGHRHNGEQELVKYEGHYRTIDNMPRGIVNAFREEHSFLRRQLSSGFSDRSMQLQEPIIGSYVDLLVRRLQEQCQGGTTALDMREWLGWTAFDIIGDLGFGSSFGCLEKTDYHPWVKIVTDSVQQMSFLSALNYVGLKPLVRLFLGMGRLAITDSQKRVRAQLKARIESGVERPDLLEGLIKKKEQGQLDFMQVATNATAIIVAGSETTATLLTGAIYLLTTHPEMLQKLTEEVRSSFNNDEDITLQSVSKLSYMLACLNESLRRYPPAAIGLPRQAPKGGAYILGKFIPEGTIVAVWQYAINHDPHFWTDPYTFAPERFMGSPKYKNDRLDAMQPFSVGPRNCIGRNLAYAEMRLILARIVYNFDMTIDESSRRWLDNQRVYSSWDKPALNIHLKPVVR